jgi:hypothetical protein
LTYQVGKLTGKELRKNQRNLLLLVGGTEDTASTRGLKVGSYKVEELEKKDEER